MRVSAILRSKDEAARLKLTLAALTRQKALTEVIVVNDGSSDFTPDVLAEAAAQLPLTVITHAMAQGRSAAANAGARAATGEILIFLDGDSLAGPDWAQRHAAVHAQGPHLVGRGETFHLRSTRFLHDPETGTPWPGLEDRLARMPAEERDRLRVTRHQVLHDFASIDRRAEPGIYPGAGPRRLYELEMDALLHHADCEVLWAAACGSNLSVRREDFLRAGGFQDEMDINEHRELALRLCLAGARMVPVPGARSYHMTHRSGWRDPLHDTGWEEIFYRAHPIPAVKLLAVFWAGLSQSIPIPREAQIASLPELAAASRAANGVDYDAVRQLIRGARASAIRS